MSDLSPAAQSVWQQFCGIVEDHGPPRLGLAAALRALVKAKPFEDFNHVLLTAEDVLTIAAELEGTNDY